MKSDPATSGYLLESGASRSLHSWHQGVAQGASPAGAATAATVHTHSPVAAQRLLPPSAASSAHAELYAAVYRGDHVAAAVLRAQLMSLGASSGATSAVRLPDSASALPRIRFDRSLLPG
jgi:hypothetical protein